MLPVERSVKLKFVNPAVPLAEDTRKSAETGLEAADTVTDLLVDACVPPDPKIVRVTENVPAALYTLEGFAIVEVEPSPKFHCREVNGPVDWSVNVKFVMPAVPLVGLTENAALSEGVPAVTVTVAALLFAFPQLFVTLAQ